MSSSLKHLTGMFVARSFLRQIGDFPEIELLLWILSRDDEKVMADLPDGDDFAFTKHWRVKLAFGGFATIIDTMMHDADGGRGYSLEGASSAGMLPVSTYRPRKFHIHIKRNGEYIATPVALGKPIENVGEVAEKLVRWYLKDDNITLQFSIPCSHLTLKEVDGQFIEVNVRSSV